MHSNTFINLRLLESDQRLSKVNQKMLDEATHESRYLNSFGGASYLYLGKPHLKFLTRALNSEVQGFLEGPAPRTPHKHI